MREFHLKFENGLRFRYVTRERPERGAEHRPEITCEGGNPGPDEFPKYKDWILATTQTLADEWNQRLVHVFVLRPDKKEMWGFEPGAKPQLISEAQ